MSIVNAAVTRTTALVAVDTDSTGPNGEKITARKLLTLPNNMILTGAGVSPFFEILHSKCLAAGFDSFDALADALPAMACAAFDEVLIRATYDHALKRMLDQNGISTSVIVLGWSDRHEKMQGVEYIQLDEAGQGFTGGPFEYAIRPSLGHNGLDTADEMRELMSRQVTWAHNHYSECHAGGKMVVCKLTKEKITIAEHDLNARIPGESPGRYLQRLAHHSFFTDRPLIPSSREKLLPEYQYTDYTSELTKAIGRFVGTSMGMKHSSFASPIVIDNYIRGWTGGMGLYVMQMIDAALRKTGVLPDPVQPTATLADIPVIRAFVVRYPSAQAKSIQDFYDRYKEATVQVHTIQTLGQRGDFDSALRELNLGPEKMFRLEGIKQTLALQNNMIHSINAMTGETPEEKANLPATKRQLIDSIYSQMIKLTLGGNALLDEVEKILKEPQLKGKSQEQSTATSGGIPL